MVRDKISIGWKSRVGQLAKQRKSTFSWMAGCIDCDGSIGWTNYKPKKVGWKAGRYPYLQFSNTNEEIVKKFAEVLGIKIIERSERTIENKLTGIHFLKVYQIRLQRVNDVLAILERLLPYLIVKKEKAIDILNTYERMPQVQTSRDED